MAILGCHWEDGLVQIVPNLFPIWDCHVWSFISSCFAILQGMVTDFPWEHFNGNPLDPATTHGSGDSTENKRQRLGRSRMAYSRACTESWVGYSFLKIHQWVSKYFGNDSRVTPATRNSRVGSAIDSQAITSVGIFSDHGHCLVHLDWFHMSKYRPVDGVATVDASRQGQNWGCPQAPGAWHLGDASKSFETWWKRHLFLQWDDWVQQIRYGMSK